MSYKAVIFDLDGTAIVNAPDARPSKRLVEAIAAKRDHIKFCAATGRPITNAHYLLEDLGLTAPCVISAGTQIVDPRTQEILWEAAIEPEDVQRVLAIAAPYHYEVLVNNELMGRGQPAAARQIDHRVNVMYIMQCAKADGEAILAELNNIPTLTAAGVLSWANEGLDIHITHRDATKEHAIGELLKLLGVPKEAAAGVGDANNDIPLFKAVGHKVAMGNATDLLKSEADEVLDTVEQDGLAKFIEAI